MVLAVMAAVFIMFFPSCGRNRADSSGDTGPRTYRIAYISRTQEDMFAAWVGSSLVKTAGEKYPNITVTVFDQQNDPQKWMELMDNCILEGYDAIVGPVVNVDPEDYIKRCREKGIFFANITFYLDFLDGVCAQVICDELDLGRAIGARAAEELPQGARVVVLNGPAGIDPSIKRRAAFDETLFSKRPDVSILDEQVANFQKSEALAKMDDWLQAHNRIDGVLSINDAMALGAVESIKSNGRSIKDFYIYGIDGLGDACQAILDGDMRASVQQNAEEYARLTLQMCNRYFTGEIPVDYSGIESFKPLLLDSKNAQETLDYLKSQGLVR
ncbi:MAG: sugar ABC transporter substrate-binding protein [Treponema sp.]|jgi:inositol transport system substrate-binding protein|nr:sugar ABC transporter substrate-binding protein [Treponema sp.]